MKITYEMSYGEGKPTIRSVVEPLVDALDEYGLPEGMEALPRFFENIVRKSESGLEPDAHIVAGVQSIRRGAVVALVRDVVARRLSEEGKPQDFILEASRDFAESIGELFAVCVACSQAQSARRLAERGMVDG